MERRERKGYYDEIRALATVLVLVVHVIGTVVNRFDELGFHKIVKFAFGSLSDELMICNGLFIALSGALLLPYREESMLTFFKKRVSKTLFPLILYYLFYLWSYGRLELSLESVFSAFKLIVSGADSQIVPHFWLFYAILNLYIVVPILRWMLKGIPESVMEKIVFFILGIFIVEFVLRCMGITQVYVPFVYGWEAYFILGYYLTLECSKKREKFWIISGICSALLIPVFHFIILPGAENSNYILYDKSQWILMMTMAVMCVIMKRNHEPGFIVKAISKYSLSILMIHWYVMFQFLPKYLKIDLLMFGPSGFLAALCIQIAVGGILSFAVAVLLDKTVFAFINKMWNKWMV